jgi:hypothetical protein
VGYTTEQLVELERAIAQGATKVKYQDREVEYQSLSAMRSLRDDIRRELGLITRQPRRRVSSHRKGLEP